MWKSLRTAFNDVKEVCQHLRVLQDTQRNTSAWSRLWIMWYRRVCCIPVKKSELSLWEELSGSNCPCDNNHSQHPCVRNCSMILIRVEETSQLFISVCQKTPRWFVLVWNKLISDFFQCWRKSSMLRISEEETLKWFILVWNKLISDLFQCWRKSSMLCVGEEETLQWSVSAYLGNASVIHIIVEEEPRWRNGVKPQYRMCYNDSVMRVEENVPVYLYTR